MIFQPPFSQPPFTLATLEAALDSRTLETRIETRDGPRWYLCRRNGRTRTWKTQPDRFVIPVKFRFRDTVQVKSEHLHSGLIDKWFRVTPQDTDLPEATP